MISLGAGKDSLFFRLMDRETAASGGYFEVDFPAVSRWKAGLVAKTPMLSTLANGQHRLFSNPIKAFLRFSRSWRGASLACLSSFIGCCPRKCVARVSFLCTLFLRLIIGNGSLYHTVSRVKGVIARGSALESDAHDKYLATLWLHVIVRDPGL